MIDRFPTTSPRGPRRLRPGAALGLTAAVLGALLSPTVPAATAAEAAPAATAAEPWNPDAGYTSTDNGDGTYRVPLMNADVPDVSVERLPAAENDEGRDVYYMISTTMHLSPGAPIMKSYDLVNWEIVNYVFNRADISDAFSLRNGQSSYGQGQWASSIRHHDGKWYVAFNTNNLGGSYLYVTDDIDDGAWERVKLPGTYHDPSLFFDVDGTPYIFYGSGSTSAVRLSADFTQVLQTYAQIIRPADFPGAPVGGLFEGAQVTYIDGTYYIVIITWPSGQGRQVVLFRSDHLLGRYATADGSNPYEAKGVLNSNGFAQGSLVPIEKDGKLDYWGMFFRDTFPIGRIPALIPATWGADGWPVFGDNGSVPVNGSFAKPIELSPAEQLLERQKSIVASDDFANDAPHRAYMDESWHIPPAPVVDTSLVGVELLTNGGFENGTSGWIVNDTATLSTSTDAASGGASGRVTGRQTTGSGPALDVSGKVQHDVTYDVTARIKYDNAASPATKPFNITARYGNSTFTNLGQVTAQRGQWATLRTSFTVPASQDLGSMRLFFETPWTSNSNALAAPDTHLMDFQVDDVSLTGRPLPAGADADEIAPTDSRLGVQWQWNHAPDNRYWSLTDRDGWLRLTNGATVTGTYKHDKLANDDELTWFEETRNTLSQRTFGPSQSVETTLDVSGMKNGDVAGLAAYNRNFSYVAVKRVDGVDTVGVVNRSLPFTASIDQAVVETFVPGTTATLGTATEVHLKADLDFANPIGQLWTTFLYSLDGKNWTQLGGRVGPQALDGSLTHFMGHRVGLFSYATQEAGGHVDVDDFLLSRVRTAQNLPLDTSDLDAAIAHAQSLQASRYPGEAWTAMQSALAAATAAKADGFGTQNQIDAPERALSLELARLGVIAEDAPSIDVTVAAGVRCAAGKALVTVQVKNDDAVPLTAEVETAFGTRSLSVAAGKSASHAFTTRAAALPAGEITTTARATVDGAPVETEVRTSYDARSCG
ncbi:family 43 glycosylhydrolase [Microbacterium enclense]|uniref:family 43 glycosylhydrolase n=1 Tax=Microbacterium enclense TaxID=993073 RepID=UPI00204003A2|nr:family 43 glycosylhydrolase [Microbacterium enclense]MCM3615103.1 family 43 glycosylhydrolase [Microbacterium enclense]